MKKFSYFLFGILISLSSFSQDKNKTDEKHENHYKQLAPFENEFFKVEFSDAHSQMAFTFIKVKISNKTNDYLEIDPSKILFNYDFGSFSPSNRKFIIDPKKAKTKKLKISGDNDFHVEKFELVLSGFSIIPSKGEVITIENFQLPPSTNNIEINGLECALSKLSQETKETSAKFNCVNKTGNFLIVNPSKIAVNSDKTTPYANDAGRSMKKALLEDGEKFNVQAVFHIPGKIVDMQFANLMIDWRDAFVSTKSNPTNITETFKMEIDPGLTAGHNK